MASRRAAPAASKIRPPVSSTNSTTTGRSRSALGMYRSTDSSVASDELPSISKIDKRTIATMPSTSYNHSIPGTPQENAETNIQVIVRCRGRTPREVTEGTPIIVNTESQRGHEVCIETGSTTSVLGVVTLAPTKTYPFDRVFGAAADQAMIYNDVVHPMLLEVLHGYNCTIFAYGQTGTGKTHTMQGDLRPSISGGPSADAGMIPRVLSKLFQHLEKNVVDYSVKVSYVELYNEELRDLLTNDSSSTGPGGYPSMGGLKIFDDSAKRGVVIQGLEEAPVKDAADAISWLRKGSHKRQVAATKFNDHSSRSHSIFTITVHTKESSSAGDDLLRVGKLNLVDLAGSENIGRSGAENKRAKEAGHINQSLLTLGRVITSLVDGASHVPYRESKLTRLLQDSLGGRTKTCIIATISPVRSNIEETMSTLEYALRAKSIRNKPEVNQRMTKNSLLKEYVVEIERLKADLLAAREKNGIYFDAEHWATVSAEQETLREQHNESRRQLEIIDLQMRAVREEFEESMAILHKRDDELKKVKSQLHTKSGQLERRDHQLRLAKVAVEEECIVREAHAKTEIELDGIAVVLKDAAKTSVADVTGLFEKITRKASTMGANATAVGEHGQTLAAELAKLGFKLDEFAKAQTQMISKVKSEAEQLRASELEALDVHSDHVQSSLRRLSEAFSQIREKEGVEKTQIDKIQAIIKETSDTAVSGFEAWSSALKLTCHNLCKEVEVAGSASCSKADDALNAVSSLLETVVSEAREFIQTEREMAFQVRTMASEAADAEIYRLQQQNTLLTQLLDSEKLKSEQTRDEMIERVSGLLIEFTDERDKSLRKAVNAFNVAATEGVRAMDGFKKHHENMTGEVVESGRKWGASLAVRQVEGEKVREGGMKAIDIVASKFKDVSKIQNAVNVAISARSSELKRQAETMGTAYLESFDRLKTTKRARVEVTETTVKEIQQSLQATVDGYAASSKAVEGGLGSVMSEASNLKSSMTKYRTSASGTLTGMRQETKQLIERGTREDVPTGSTPQKRIFEFTENWELTKGRDALLKEWREKQPLRKVVDVALPGEHGDGDFETTGGDEEVGRRGGIEEDVVDDDVERESEPRSTTPPLPKPTVQPSLNPAVTNGALGRKMSIGGFKAPVSYKVPLADKGNIAIARGRRLK